MLGVLDRVSWNKRNVVRNIDLALVHEIRMSGLVWPLVEAVNVSSRLVALTGAVTVYTGKAPSGVRCRAGRNGSYTADNGPSVAHIRISPTAIFSDIRRAPAARQNAGQFCKTPPTATDRP